MPTSMITIRIETKIKEAIEKAIPDRWVSVTQFTAEALVEKLKREGLI